MDSNISHWLWTWSKPAWPLDAALAPMSPRRRIQWFSSPRLGFADRIPVIYSPTSEHNRICRCRCLVRMLAATARHHHKPWSWLQRDFSPQKGKDASPVLRQSWDDVMPFTRACFPRKVSMSWRTSGNSKWPETAVWRLGWRSESDLKSVQTAWQPRKGKGELRNCRFVFMVKFGFGACHRRSRDSLHR